MPLVHDPSSHDPSPAAEAAAAAGVASDAAAAVVIDERGRVVEATAAAAALLGLEAADLAGRGLADLADDRWHWVVRNTLLRLRAGSLAPFDLMLRQQAGQRVLVQVVPRPFEDAFAQRAFLLLWGEPQRTEEATPAPIARGRAAAAPPLAYELLRSQEVERERVAATLHDDVASSVTAVKFMVENAVASLARGAARETEVLLAETIARLREVHEAVCRTATELRPGSLDDLGLLPTIEWYCRQISAEHPGLKVTLDLNPCATLDSALAVDIFRVLQEALRNIDQHARARAVHISLACTAGRLQFAVQDDGVGFDAAAFLRGETSFAGLGLRSIHKRVVATGGALELRSSPATGTLLGASWTLF